MENLNITISKTFDDHYCVQPSARGKYDSKTFWVAKIQDIHPQYGFDQDFIQDGDIAYMF